MQASHDELETYHTLEFNKILESALRSRSHAHSAENREDFLRSLYTVLLKMLQSGQKNSPLPPEQDGDEEHRRLLITQDDPSSLTDPNAERRSPSLGTSAAHPKAFDEEGSAGEVSTITSIILKHYANKPMSLKKDKKKKPAAKKKPLNEASSSNALTPDNSLFMEKLLTAVAKVEQNDTPSSRQTLFDLLDTLFEYFETNPDWEKSFASFEKKQADIINSLAGANQANNQIAADQKSRTSSKMIALLAVLGAISALCYAYGSHDTQDAAAESTFHSFPRKIITAIAYTATAGLAAFAGTSGPRFAIKFFNDIRAYFRKKTPSSSVSASTSSPEEELAKSELPKTTGKQIARNVGALLLSLVGAGSTIAMQEKNGANLSQVIAIVYSALLTNSNSLEQVVPDTFTKVIPDLFDVYKKAIPNVAKLFQEETSRLDIEGLEEVNTMLTQDLSSFLRSATPGELGDFIKLKECLITSFKIKDINAPTTEKRQTLARIDQITFLMYQLQRIMNVLILQLNNGPQDYKTKLEEATEPQTKKRAGIEGGLACCFAAFAAVGAIPYWAVRGEAQTIFTTWFNSTEAGAAASYLACGVSTANNLAVNVKSGFAVGKELTVNLLDNIRELFSKKNPAEKAALVPTATMAGLVAIIYDFVTLENGQSPFVAKAAGASTGMNVLTAKSLFNEAMSGAGKALSYCGSKIGAGFTYLKNGCKTAKSQETGPQRDAREKQERRQAIQKEISKNLNNLLERISGVADHLSTKTTAGMLRQIGVNPSSAVPEFTSVAIESSTTVKPTVRNRVVPTSETQPLLVPGESPRPSYHTGTGLLAPTQSVPELDLRGEHENHRTTPPTSTPSTYFSAGSRTPNTPGLATTPTAQ